MINRIPFMESREIQLHKTERNPEHHKKGAEKKEKEKGEKEKDDLLKEPKGETAEQKEARREKIAERMKKDPAFREKVVATVEKRNKEAFKKLPSSLRVATVAAGVAAAVGLVSSFLSKRPKNTKTLSSN